MLRSRGDLSRELAVAAASASEAADEKYVALMSQSAAADDSLRLFSLARLLRGIGIAFGAVAGEDVADAVYELTRTVEDPSAILRSIRSDIDGLTRK
jgi:hypothetical protein